MKVMQDNTFPKNLIISGNGFDLDLGLNTSFATFKNSYDFKLLPDISFIKDIRGSYWCDIEDEIRTSLIKYSKNPSPQISKEINDAWQFIVHEWGNFLPKQIELSKLEINRKSHAYALLEKQLINTDWFTFNYTHPRYLCQLKGKEPICIHNECIELDYAKSHKMAYINFNNLIIGVDSNMPQCVKENEQLKHIIKQENPTYKSNIASVFKTKLAKANNIIIFGHALGCTDSDYFKEFFLNCSNNKYQNKNIYIITLNHGTLNKIKENLHLYDIEYNKIINSKNKILPIFTNKDTDEKDFKQLIEILTTND